MMDTRSLLLRKKKLLLCLYMIKQKKERRFWVRKIYSERETKGEYCLPIKDLKLFDQEYFFRQFRMSPSIFELLLSMVGPRLKKPTTNMRDPISPSERLTVTLRYLVTGDAQVTIAASYRMSPTTVGRIIKETCQVIWEEMLSNDYLAVPSTINAWKTIGLDFEKRWNFPNVLGAIDGKHVVIQAPSRSGSAFFNYKKTFSIVLMAVCDSKYRFIMVDIGDTGRQSDGSVYANSFLQLNTLKLPTDGNMPIGSQRNLPYVFIGDDAFALKTNMMKPYPFQNLPLDEKIFNYRLSRARRTIENTFGIAASRFRIFYRPIKAELKTVVFITKAVVALHNFLMSENNNNLQYCPPNLTDQEGPNGYIPGEWRRENSSGLEDIRRIGSNNYSTDARVVRDAFKDYFNNEGSVDWQLDTVNRK